MRIDIVSTLFREQARNAETELVNTAPGERMGGLEEGLEGLERSEA